MKKIIKLIFSLFCILLISACTRNENKEINNNTNSENQIIENNDSHNETNYESIKETNIETIEETKLESIEETNVETAKETSDETLKDIENLDKTSYSWSFAYPERLDLLKKYNGYYKINTNRNVIYLTFDNGYEYNKLTPKILDILKKKNVKTVFFTTSDFLESEQKTVKRMINEGNIVANHTHKHLHHGKISHEDIKNDLLEWENTYKRIYGYTPVNLMYRPPAGSYSEISLKTAHDLAYDTIFWNFAYADWDPENQPNENEALTKLLKHNEKGSIVLLHAVSQTNVNILEKYIDETRNQGFEFEQLNTKI